MGAWTTRIFDDDGAADIIGEYRMILGYGVPNEVAYQKIKEYFYKDYAGQDDEDVYWLSIALFQWQNGILMEEVKKEALRCIESGQYLEVWKESGKKVYEKRKEILETLKDKLLHEVNPLKKIKKCPSYYRTKTSWKVGDLLIYQVRKGIEGIEGSTNIPVEIVESEKRNRSKKFLLRVVAVNKIPVSNIYPELDYTSSADVMLYDWSGDTIPSDEVIDKLAFRKIIIERMNSGMCKVSNGVSIIYDKQDREFAEITVHSNDKRFQEHVPQLYIENSGCPACDTSNFNFYLALTFAFDENVKMEWEYKDKTD